jgi:hypothetical protein
LTGGFARAYDTVSQPENVVHNQKIWEVRMTRASIYVAVGACLAVAAGGSLRQASSQTAAPTMAAQLNYEFFKTKVQPVFLAKRPGHARCVVCHTFNNAPFKVVPLSPGATTWNEEQSQRNFELVKRVTMPGFLDSALIKHPLAEEAGGDAHHGGAQQFASKEDPDWLTLKAFVMGETVK